MKDMMSSIRSWKMTARNLEHEGFYHGSQGCKPDDAQAEISAHFGQELAKAESKAAPAIHDLEIKLGQCRAAAPEIERRWQALQEQFGDEPPPTVIPAILTLAGIFSTLVEAVMLAPCLDLLNITQPIEQRIAALAIGLVGTVCFHYAFESLQPNRFCTSARWTIRGFAGCTFIALAVLGILRGHQIAFGADLNDNPLGRFMHEFPLLVQCVFAFFTVAFPLAGALAVTFGIKDLRDHYRYTTAKAEAHQVQSVLAELPKKLEGQRAALESELKQIHAKEKEWKSVYMVQHERGAAMQVAQMPAWMVLLKACCVTLIAFVVCIFLLGFEKVATYAIPVIACTAACIRGYYARFHPKPSQVFRHQSVSFRETLHGIATLAPKKGLK